MPLYSSQSLLSSDQLAPLVEFYFLGGKSNFRSRKEWGGMLNFAGPSQWRLFLESLKKNDDVTPWICGCPGTTEPCRIQVWAANLRLLAACLSGWCCFGSAGKGEIYTGEESVHMRQQPQTFRPSVLPHAKPSPQLRISH